MVQLAPDPLEIVVTRRGGTAVIKPCGSADMFEVGSLRDQLAALLTEAPIVVLDLSETEFIGSEGLAAIVSGHLQAGTYRGELRLAAPQPAVLRLLETTRLTEVLPIYRSVEEALPN